MPLFEKTRAAALAIFLLAATAANGQWSVGVKWSGLTAHLKKSPQGPLFRGKLDKKGRFVATDGMALMVDFAIADRWNLRFVHLAVPHDCRGRFIGMAHVGLGPRAVFSDRAEGFFSFGPMFFYRRPRPEPGFERDSDRLFRLSSSGNWQRKFVWHGGTVDFDWRLRGGSAASFSLLPGVPEIVSLAPGWRTAPIKSGF